MFRRIRNLAIVFFTVSAAYLGWQMTARAAYESAPYTVVQTDGSFEVREYPELMLATTKMTQSQPQDGSFMRLFRYITGNNVDNQEVAMTTPVFMERGNVERMGSEGQMGFVMPQAVVQQGIPQPSGSNVRLRRRAAGRFAAIRFAGRLDQETVTEKKAELQQWMKENQLVGESDYETAGYDPPMTPAALRRNEILIRIKQDGK